MDVKKVAIGVGVGVVVLGVGFVGVGMLLPSGFTVERSTTIAASPEQIYAYVGHLDRWEEWTVWNTTMDPGMKREVARAEGVGASMSWNGPKVGQGVLTLTAADPATGIAYDLAFDDGAFGSKGAVAFAADGAGTKVTWSDHGELSGPLMRYFGLMADGMMGPDFASNLANLKAKAEADAAAVPPAPPPAPVEPVEPVPAVPPPPG
jgi:hypothetical protein